MLAVKKEDKKKSKKRKCERGNWGHQIEMTPTKHHQHRISNFSFAYKYSLLHSLSFHTTTLTTIQHSLSALHLRLHLHFISHLAISFVGHSNHGRRRIRHQRRRPWFRGQNHSHRHHLMHHGCHWRAYVRLRCGRFR